MTYVTGQFFPYIFLAPYESGKRSSAIEADGGCNQRGLDVTPHYPADTRR